MYIYEFYVSVSLKNLYFVEVYNTYTFIYTFSKFMRPLFFIIKIKNGKLIFIWIYRSSIISLIRPVMKYNCQDFKMHFFKQKPTEKLIKKVVFYSEMCHTILL